MFPIRDNRGDVVGFGGRVIDEDDDPKYLNSPETTLFKKGYLLYGLFEGKQEISNTKEVILVQCHAVDRSTSQDQDWSQSSPLS